MEKKSLYIITGASKGLGLALKNTLIKLPHTSVIGVSRSPIQAENNFTPIQLDLEDSESLINKITEIFPKGEYEEIVLINNAGWIGEIAYNGNLSSEAIVSIHAVNVIAPALLMNAFMKTYKHHKGSKIIVNITSGAAAKVVDGWSGYSASKAALNQMTLIAQKESEIKHLGFKLFALSPGVIDTPMQASIRSARPNEFSSLAKFKSLKEDGESEVIAQKVLYLIAHPNEFEEVLQDVRKF
ncbi:SDR family NAD(P)-dependent oxidoreductase [Cyclobacterium sp. 1_MG-2023]|uniref:SDR family NAD(P)-dependent oxidoreductase n=1 Tax=Cyclobacterium sp. 1_MG-2023 TaxID=3062681 RepID=UPI0026E21E3D|nr:SDR family NAD(P)-dependent oxidoreductase [Cyclobacterium sp. 1_MG-2023]MDO6439381.1 SDR family NAD(P)-dependent oxidoreductase [Cyclobacterium sp. 1_MG-2023]